MRPWEGVKSTGRLIPRNLPPFAQRMYLHCQQLIVVMPIEISPTMAANQSYCSHKHPACGPQEIGNSRKIGRFNTRVQNQYYTFNLASSTPLAVWTTTRLNQRSTDFLLKIFPVPTSCSICRFPCDKKNYSTSEENQNSGKHNNSKI